MSFGSYDPTKQANRGTRRKTFYLKDGSNLFRVMPPAKSLADKNQIAKYYSMFWLTDSRGSKKPIVSILRKQKDVVLQYDPILTRLEEMKKQLEVAMAGNENPATILALKENIKRIFHKKFYALNVLDAGGTPGVLEIPYTSYQNLEARIRELHTQGLDAIGIGPDKGIFFDFKKQKDEKGRTIYPVDPATRTGKDANNQFIISYIRMPLTDEDANRLSASAEDLTTLYRELTVEEQTALSSLDQRVFDVIFARPVNSTENQEGPAYEDPQEQQYRATANGNVVSVAPPLTGNMVPAVPTQQQPNYGQGNTVQQPQVVYPSYTGPYQNVGPVNSQPVVQAVPTITFVQPPPAPITSFQPAGSVMNNDKVKNFLFPENKKV